MPLHIYDNHGNRKFEIWTRKEEEASGAAVLIFFAILLFFAYLPTIISYIFHFIADNIELFTIGFIIIFIIFPKQVLNFFSKLFSIVIFFSIIIGVIAGIYFSVKSYNEYKQEITTENQTHFPLIQYLSNKAKKEVQEITSRYTLNKTKNLEVETNLIASEIEVKDDNIEEILSENVISSDKYDKTNTQTEQTISEESYKTEEHKISTYTDTEFDANILTDKSLMANITPEMLEKYIIQGASVNTKDANGFTPLMLAVSINNNPEVIKMLLKYNADIEAIDMNGASILMYACRNTINPKIIQILIDNGAKIEDGNKLLDLLDKNEYIEKNQDYWDLRDRIYNEMNN